MDKQEQFELHKAKEICYLRIQYAKEKYVYKRDVTELLKRIARWEAWTYEHEKAYRQRKTQNA